MLWWLSWNLPALALHHCHPLPGVQFKFTEGDHNTLDQQSSFLPCMELGSGRVWARCALAESWAGREAVPLVGDSIGSLSQSLRSIKEAWCWTPTAINWEAAGLCKGNIDFPGPDWVPTFSFCPHIFILPLSLDPALPKSFQDQYWKETFLVGKSNLPSPMTLFLGEGPWLGILVPTIHWPLGCTSPLTTPQS